MKKIISLLLCTGLYLNIFCQEKQKIPRGEKGSYAAREVSDTLSGNENIKEGPYVMWYEGVKVISGNYSGNKKNGLWKYSNIDGIVSFQGIFTDDKKNGEWNYFRNQKPLATIYFKDDVMDSLWQSFFDNGKIQNRINYSMGKKNGAYQLYYENGRLAADYKYTNDAITDTAKRFYNDGTEQLIIQFKNNEVYNVIVMNDSLGKKQDAGTFANGTGTLKQYYSNGKLRSEVEYTAGKMNGTAKLYDKSGEPVSVFHFENGKASGKQTEYDKEGLISNEGECLNGFKSGKWNSYSNGARYYEKYYSMADSATITIPYYGPPLPVSEVMPRAQGGEAGMLKYISSNIKYPQNSRDAGISGNVYVTFVIDRNGSVKDAKLLRGRMPDLDEEALRVVNSMPPWTPGFQGGLPVKVQFNLPIKYTLR